MRLAPTRTDKVPNTSATAASSGADLNGAAIKNACEQILARIVDVPGATWEERVHNAYFQRIQLWAAGFYKTEGLHWDSAAMRGEPFKYFAYGVAASEVEVDGFDGSYTLRRVDIVHDVGDSLSPLIDIGQIEGGFVQGMGWLTTEELVFDAEGRLRTHAPSTYKIPACSDRPRIFNVALLVTLGALIVPAAASAAPRMWMGFQDDPYFRWLPERFFMRDRAVHANSTIMKTTVYWFNTAPRRPANPTNPFDPAYRWEDLDEFVARSPFAGASEDDVRKRVRKDWRRLRRNAAPGGTRAA